MIRRVTASEQTPWQSTHSTMAPVQRVVGAFFTAKKIMYLTKNMCLGVALLLLTLPALATAARVTVSWDPNTEPDLAGYKVLYGTSSRVYTDSIIINSPSESSLEISGLQEGLTYYFAVKAFDAAMQESECSDEVSKYLPPSNVAPRAQILATPTSGLAPLAVSFDATPSSDSDGTIIQYGWQFGDGASATGPRASHTYNAAGTYSATLTVTDNAGATGSVTATVEVRQGYLYTWRFGENAQAHLPGTAEDTYLGLDETDYAAGETLRVSTWPAGQAASAILMKWDLSAIPVSAEIKEGALQLHLSEVSGGGGADAYAVYVHEVVNVDPLVSLSTGYTYDGTNGWTANNLCYNNIPLAQADVAPAEDCVTVGKAPDYTEWNISGMVRKWVASPDQNHGLLLNPDLAARPESYRAFSSSEAADPAQRPILTVTFATGQPIDLAPKASLAATPCSGKAPLTVAFDASASQDPEGAIARYLWAFGDGSSGEGPSTTHTYQTPGQYSAVVTVTDGAGGTDSAQVVIQVCADQAPVARVTAQPMNGQAPLTVSLDGTGSTDSDGAIETYVWNLGDGATAAGPSTEHTFGTAGDYTVTLTVTDDGGGSAEATMTIHVTANGPPVIARFTVSETSPRNPLTVVRFEATVSDPEGDTLTYLLAFGDGEGAEALPVSHTYKTAGTYEAVLTVTDGHGGRASRVLTIQVNDEKPAPPENLLATGPNG